MNPCSYLPEKEAVMNNLVNGNSGNMIFAHSICRTLMVEDMQIDTIRMSEDVSDEDIERINSEYESFVIPLANAFHPDFIPEMNRLTSMIRRLSIPCVVVGVGIQKRVTEDSAEVFADASKEFIKAVLEHSAVVGLRGEMTAVFLKKLDLWRRGTSP